MSASKLANHSGTLQCRQGTAPLNSRTVLRTSNFSCRPRRLQITAAIKKSGAKHVICSKTLVAKTDQAKRLLKKCQDILDFSLGKASNPENGIIEFSCNQDIYDKNVFHFWERYDGNASLGRHNTTPEFVKFMEGVSLTHFWTGNHWKHVSLSYLE